MTPHTGSSPASATGPVTPGGVSPGRADGATARTPIKLGFVVTNFGNAGSLGVNVGQTFSDRQMYDALVSAMNKAGGIDGRRIEPVYAVTDTASTNSESDYQAACSTFTEDNHVAAVLGHMAGWFDSFESCLARAGVPHLSAATVPGDETAQRQFPTMFSTTNPTAEGHNLTVLNGAVASGLLAPSTKLGVILDACGHNDRAWRRSAAPYLVDHHIPYDLAEIACGDNRAPSEIQNAELRFRTNGVAVVFVESVAAILFMNSAESQQWHPTYLMSIRGSTFESNAPKDQLKNVHGFGWLPVEDVNLSHQPYSPLPGQRRCLSMLRSEGLEPKAFNDFFGAYSTCDALFLYADALRLNGGDTRALNVVAALSRVAPRLEGATTYGGRLAVSNASHGGPALWRAWSWSSGCSCFTYTGSPHAMPAV